MPLLCLWVLQCRLCRGLVCAASCWKAKNGYGHWSLFFLIGIERESTASDSCDETGGLPAVRRGPPGQARRARRTAIPAATHEHEQNSVNRPTTSIMQKRRSPTILKTLTTRGGGRAARPCRHIGKRTDCGTCSLGDMPCWLGATGNLHRHGHTRLSARKAQCDAQTSQNAAAISRRRSGRHCRLAGTTPYPDQGGHSPCPGLEPGAHTQKLATQAHHARLRYSSFGAAAGT